jgi:hypothetical protein
VAEKPKNTASTQVDKNLFNVMLELLSEPASVISKVTNLHLFVELNDYCESPLCLRLSPCASFITSTAATTDKSGASYTADNETNYTAA